MCEEASGDSTSRYYPRIVSCPHIAGIQRVPHGIYKTAAITGRADLCFRATPEKREAKVDRERRKIGEKEEEVF